MRYQVANPLVSRRAFLQAGIGLGLSLGLDRLVWLTPADAVAAPVPEYSDFRDLYRAKWRWDRVVRGTHTNVNCVSSCAWNLFVRDGIVWREEQSSPYTASNDSVPDWNPRGCQKGASCSDMMQSASRLRFPLKRAGARGEGRWKRVTWDEALGEIAEQMVDTLDRRGGEGVLLELGPNVDFGGNTAAGLRFFRQIGAPITDSMAQIGDLAVGGTITLGTPHTDGTSDDWFRSELIVMWAFNPAATRIPDAHYIHEARYHGARVVAIAPDYNQSAIHADLWLSVRPGTDAALALAACQVVIEENLFDAAYIREQTDLPFLLRADTGRFLRESDLVEGGGDETLLHLGRAGGCAAPRDRLDGQRRTDPDDRAGRAPGPLGAGRSHARERRARGGANRLRRTAREAGRTRSRAGRGDHRRVGRGDPPLRARLRQGTRRADPLAVGKLQEPALRPRAALADPARVAHRQPRACGRRLALGRLHRARRAGARGDAGRARPAQPGHDRGARLPGPRGGAASIRIDVRAEFAVPRRARRTRRA